MRKQSSKGTCEFLDLTIPEIPPRSRLYSPDPEGIGTSYVESLTSWIARLAFEHSVSVRTLMMNELLPADKQQKYSAQNRLSAFWRSSGQTINGGSKLASYLSEILEKITKQKNVHALTFLPWATNFSPVGVLKVYRSWCPLCFDGLQKSSKTIYEPLIWQVKTVTFCPLHQEMLVERCPYTDCGARSYTLTSNMRVGHCPKCSRWLGIRTDVVKKTLSDEEWEWHNWVGNTIGELLARNALDKKIYRAENMKTLATKFLSALNWKRHMAAYRNLQATLPTIKQWRTEEQSPQLELILRLCYTCNISICDLLLSQPELFMVNELSLRMLPSSLGKYMTHRTPVPLDLNKIRQTLESILAGDEPPLSMHEVANRLGHNDKVIRKHFPELCKAISRKYLDFISLRSQQKKELQIMAIKQAIKELEAQNQNPTYSRVESTLRVPLKVDFIRFHSYWREALNELAAKN